MADHFDRLQIPHPANRRNDLDRWRLLLPLVLPFLVWGTGLVFKFFFIEAACTPGSSLASLSPDAIRRWTLLIDGLVLILLLLLAILGYKNWHAVRGERESRSQLLLDRGEGRTEILAHWGFLLSAGFVIVSIFDSVPTLMAPLCGLG